MPELPEMETYRRLLEPRVAQRTIVSVDVERAKSLNTTVDRFRSAVQYHTIIRVDRVAKQLVFTLDNGLYLALHLKLGGWMFFGKDSEKPDRTVQVRLGFGADSLYLINLRLGHLHLLDQDEWTDLTGKYGPDPFDTAWTGASLYQKLTSRRGVLKPVLIDQSFIAGIGNCYSDEICFAAGILPTRSCSSLNRDDCERLLAAMRHVLAEAVRYGGYMEHQLYTGDTLTGGYDERCQVYDRKNEPCIRCGKPIILETIRSRKTYYCNNCQR